jgi:TolB-like protein
MNSAEDLTFLQRGIADMLSTRLTFENRVKVMDRETAFKAVDGLSGPVNLQTAIDLARKASADYVVYGSVTVFGEAISTDARFAETAGQKDLVTFSQAGSSPSDAIAHINQFAAQVNETVFNRKTVVYQQPAAQTPQGTDSHMHPDTLWSQEQGTIEPGTFPAGEAPLLGAIWRSHSFNNVISGMAIGDVDGDGLNETVFIADQTLFVYRLVGGKFAKVAEHPGKGEHNFLGVDVADVNGNGKAEIFVTKYSTRTNRLNSFVLEWEKSALVRIADNQAWYFRTTSVPDHGPVLFGQKQGMSNIFQPGVYELDWHQGNYVELDRVPAPKNVSVYGFAMGNVMNSGQNAVAAFLNDDRIRIFDDAGEDQWTSAESYGGRMVYVDTRNASTGSIGAYKEFERTYLPPRLFIQDVDGDGKNELIAVKNKEAANRVLSRIRLFQAGHIECLEWNTLGMRLKWKTQEAPGYISDYAIADIDNDGKPELVFSVVSKTGTAFSDSRSFIASQQLQ